MSIISRLKSNKKFMNSNDYVRYLRKEKQKQQITFLSSDFKLKIISKSNRKTQ